MKKDILLSIIIPVYNIRAYLPECLDSLLRQHPDRAKIICIDDHSADGSGELCDQYAQKYEQLRVCHLAANQGLGYVRNQGLKLARGEYLAWLDADDYLSEKWYASLLAVVEKFHPEMALFDHYRVEGSKVTLKEYGLSGGWLNKTSLMEDIVEDDKIINVLWLFIFKRSLMQNLWFPVQNRYMTDYAVLTDIIDRAGSIYYLRCPLYYYRQRSSSNIHILNLSRDLKGIRMAQDRYQRLLGKYPGISREGCLVQMRAFCKNYLRAPAQEQLAYAENYRQVRRMMLNDLRQSLFSPQIRIKTKIKCALMSTRIYEMIRPGRKK